MIGKLIKVGIVGLVAGGGYAAYWYWRRYNLAQARAMETDVALSKWEAALSEESESKQEMPDVRANLHQPVIEVGQVWEWADPVHHPQIGEVSYFVVNRIDDDWESAHVTQLGAVSEIGGKTRYTRLRCSLDLSIHDVYLLYAHVPGAEVLPSK